MSEDNGVAEVRSVEAETSAVQPLYGKDVVEQTEMWSFVKRGPSVAKTAASLP